LYQDGLNIVAVDINLSAVEALAHTLNRSSDQRVVAIQADMGDERSISAMVDQAGELFGRIDVVVNNAAINLRGSIYDFNPEHWDKMMAVNLRGPALLCQKIAPFWVKQQSGRVINIV
ncbi:SDR family NAD(P)-dependent oxidoreductase, partial [Pseudomonas sp. CCC2.2]